jgi:hypothetical protein
MLSGFGFKGQDLPFHNKKIKSDEMREHGAKEKSPEPMLLG